ncbi:MAG: SusC/RagA family TonB-linked outer membrane protein [Longimicrobiales bacterium]
MLAIRYTLTILAAAALLPGVALGQERGTVTGQVINAATRQPMTAVQMSVAGTTLGTITGQDGRYVIRNVPAGSHEVRAILIGYSEMVVSVDVAAGGSATADFELRQTAVTLEGLVVTASGELQRLRERGNVVSQIQLAEIEPAVITRMSDVLQGRSAGVVVQQPSGTSGTGARVRVRGSASASLSNQPLIIIDGARVNDAPESFSIMLGGQSTSRLEDLNPADIESIEILKGPAAAALYGTAAATGVIQITTRRGQIGESRWNAYTEAGMILERNQWPGNYLMLGVADDGEETPCWTFLQASRDCTPTELLEWNPLMDREEGNGVSNPELGPASPFRDGSRRTYGLNVAGGSDVVTYYLSGEVDDENGIFQNNNLNRVSLRANLRGQLRDNLDVTLTTGWTSSEAQLPSNDNATSGVIGNAITGAPEDDPERRGYELQSPDELALVDTRQSVRRLTSSLNASYRPFPWLNVVGTAGLDVLNRHDEETVPPETILLGSLPEGRRESNRIEVSNYTATLGATATRMLAPSISSTSSAGVQYHQETFHGTFAVGWRLLAGTGSLAGTNARFEADEQTQDVVTVGAYVQQQFGYQDRIFLTGALRGDDNSSFGSEFGLALYPSLSASWVIGEEPWFPSLGPVNSVRLRGALGRSGLQPGFRQAATFFAPVPATVDARDVAAFTIGGVGDPDLRPEISTEIEAGIDLGMFDNRLGIEFTYYTKTSRDALVARRLAPSLGMSETRFENVGTVRNRGIEALVNADLISRPNLLWSATLSVATNDNLLVEMDGDPIIFGLASGQQHRTDYPLGGYWQTPYTWEDPDGDGLLRIEDIVMADSMEFAGTPFPTRNISFGTSVMLFDIVRVSGLIEHQGGHTQWSGTDEWQCVFLLCRDLNDPSTSPELQARGLADFANFSWWGYLEDASFTKLREVAVKIMAPQQIAQRLRVDGLSLTISGRNLATWTDYTGLDPEANFGGQSNFTTAEFQTQPPVRLWTARVDVNF